MYDIFVAPFLSLNLVFFMSIVSIKSCMSVIIIALQFVSLYYLAFLLSEINNYLLTDLSLSKITQMQPKKQGNKSRKGVG